MDRHAGKEVVLTAVIEVQVRVRHVGDIAGREPDLTQAKLQRVLRGHHGHDLPCRGQVAEGVPGIVDVDGVHAGVEQHPRAVIGFHQEGEDGDADVFAVAPPRREDGTSIDVAVTQRHDEEPHVHSA